MKKFVCVLTLLALTAVVGAEPKPHVMVIRPKEGPTVRWTFTKDGKPIKVEQKTVERLVPDYIDPSEQRDLPAVLTPEERGTVIR